MKKQNVKIIIRINKCLTIHQKKSIIQNKLWVLTQKISFFVFVILFIGTILIISFVYCCKFIRKPTFSDPHQHIIRDDEHSTNQAYMIRFQPIK
jgi:hypothetical protein